MDFVEKVRRNLEGKLKRSEGNCGTCHRVLREISSQGGVAVARERPDGISSEILDDRGNIVGRGEGITWPPAILFAEVEAGFMPGEIEGEIMKSLECIIDMEKVADIYGYGRVVTPVAAAYNEVWSQGGRVEIRRNKWGIEVIFYDKNDETICVGPISYCPTCGTASTIPRAPEIAARIKKQLENKRNTGEEKYKRKMENWFYVKNGRVYCEIKENGETIGKSAKCCIAYAGVCAEVKAGIAGQKWGALFKEYCKICPVKLCNQGKDSGRAGNLILKSLEARKLKTEVGINTYLTAKVRRDRELLGEGIGTVCAFSALVNAAAKSINLKSEMEIIREQ